MIFLSFTLKTYNPKVNMTIEKIKHNLIDSLLGNWLL